MLSSFTFDSRNIEYRKPFGAIPVGSTVQLFVKTSGIKEVSLMIHKDGCEIIRYPMHSLDNGFQIEITIDCVTLYFYHFEVISEENTIIHYGNNAHSSGGTAVPHSTSDYQISVYAYEDYAPVWYREGRAYHIFLDRFSKSKHVDTRLKENSFIYASTKDLPMYIKDNNGDIIRWDFYGGDLWGVIDQLEYLKSMDITILYLSPIFTARSNHRYDTQNYLEIDPMLGGEEAFLTLLIKTKQLGIKIILDGVFNHCGADSIYFDYYNKYGNGAYHNTDSPYRDWFTFYEDNTYEAWWGILDLPRFQSQSLSYREFILSVVKKWSSYEIGGWRLDVVDELEDDFIKDIRNCLSEDQVLIGEVWEDPTNKISYDVRRGYVNGGILHGVMNYPLRDSIIQFLNQTITSEKYKDIIEHYLENSPDYLIFNNLNNIGTHDTVRLQNMLNFDEDLVKLAIVMLCMMPGVPCIYYGDEIGLQGDKDPDNRRFFDWSRVGNSLQQFTKNQLLFRKEHSVLINGKLEIETVQNCTVITRKDSSVSIHAIINPCENESRFVYDEKPIHILPKSYLIFENKL